MASDTPALSDRDYRALTDATLASIEATIDQWLDQGLVDIDAHRTGGLLELSFPNGTVIVVNTQPPVQELWLATRNAGHHHRYVDGRWRDTRDGSDFFETLSRAASEQSGRDLRFSGPA
jgi:CyaY protein